MIRSRTWNKTDNVYYRPSAGLALYYEFVSTYRRVIVVAEGNGFELRVSYKRLPLNSWSKRYGTKEDAIAWAKVQSANNDILMGCITIKDYGGRKVI